MMIAQTLSFEDCAIVVPMAADNTPVCLLGLSVTGTDAELDAVQAEAKAHGLRTSRLTNPQAPSEQMVGFIPGTSTADIAAMFAAARKGRFGGAKLKILVALKSAAADGIELQTEARYIDPASVVLPVK
jgi:hypothetical protein